MRISHDGIRRVFSSADDEPRAEGFAGDDEWIGGHISPGGFAPSAPTPALARAIAPLGFGRSPLFKFINEKYRSCRERSLSRRRQIVRFQPHHRQRPSSRRTADA